MTIGKMKLSTDNVENHDDVVDFSSLESGANKEFYKEITKFINKWVDDKVDEPDTLKSMAKGMAGGKTFDQWFDDNEIYKLLYTDLLVHMEDYAKTKRKYKEELKDLKKATKALAAIKRKTFKLTDQGKSKLNNSSSIDDSDRPDGDGNDKYKRVSKLTKKERKYLQKHPEHKEKLDLRDKRTGRGTGVFYEANQYKHRWETKVYDQDTEKFEAVDNAYRLPVTAKDYMNPNNKANVRRSFELFFDNEEGKELRIQHFPKKLFTEPHGFFNVMRSLTDVATGRREKVDQQGTLRDIDKDKVAEWIDNGFQGIKPKDIAALGMKQPRKLKMVKILQRAKWEDLQLLTSVLSNSSSVEQGITNLWNAYSRTGQAVERTDKLGFVRSSEKFENVLNEDTFYDIITDLNYDLSDAVGADKYVAGEKVGKLRRHAEFKNFGDAFRLSGPQMKHIMKSEKEKLDVLYNGKGEEIINQNLIREIHGQILISDYMNQYDIDDGKESIFGSAMAKELKSVLEGYLEESDLNECSNENFVELIKEQPYFLTMVQAGLLTSAGASETTNSRPSPINLQDTLNGRTVETIAKQRKNEMWMKLGEKTVSLLTSTDNPELKKLVEEEGLLKAKHTFLTGLMKIVDGMVLRGNVGDYRGLIEEDAQKMSLLAAVLKNFHKIILNPQPGGTIGFSFPIAKWKGELGKNGRGYQEGQVFAGVERNNITHTPVFTLGVRQSVEARLDRIDNIELRNIKPAKYLGAEAELMGKLDAGIITNSDLELSAGMSYTMRWVKKIEEAEGFYSQALKHLLPGPDSDTVAGVDTVPEVRAMVRKLKGEAINNINIGKNKFTKKNYDVLRDNLDVIFGMVEKEFTRPENIAILQSNEGPSVLLDLMMSMSDACVGQWKDGQISALHNQIKFAGFSAGVRVSLMKTLKAVATYGGSVAADALTTQETPIDVYVGIQLATFRKKNISNAAMKMERYNQYTRGISGDPLEALPVSERTTAKYAEYLDANYHSDPDYLEVTTIEKDDGTQLIKMTLSEEYQGSDNIADFLNLHVTDEAIEKKLFHLDGRELVFGCKFNAGSIVEPDGVTNMLSLGGNISVKEKGIYRYDSDFSAKRRSRDMEVDDYKDVVPGFKDPYKIIWDESGENFQEVLDGAVADFLANLEDKARGEVGRKILAAANEYFESDEFKEAVTDRDDTDFDLHLDFDEDGDDWVVGHAEFSRATTEGEIVITMDSEEFDETINDIEEDDIKDMIEDLAGKSSVRRVLRDLGKDKDDLIQLFEDEDIDEEKLKKIKSITFLKAEDSDDISIDVDFDTSVWTEEVEVGLSFERGSVEAEEAREYDNIKFDFSDELKDIFSVLKNERHEGALTKIDTYNSNKILYYKFMEAASNVDGNTSASYELDEGEYSKAFGILITMLRNGNFGPLATQLENLSKPEDKMLVVNRFKQMFSYDRGLHSTKMTMARLMRNRQSYKDLLGPTGEPIGSDMVALFDKVSERFANSDPKVGNPNYKYNFNDSYEGSKASMFYGAFYRKGGPGTRQIKSKGWHFMAPGTVDVLDNFVYRAESDAEDETMIKGFVDYFKEDGTSHDFIMEQLKALDPDADWDSYDFNRESVTELIETGTTLVDKEGADEKSKIEIDRSGLVSAVAQCGNRCFGLTINSLKITEGKTTTEEDLVEKVEKKFEGEEEVTIDASGDGDAPDIEEVEGSVAATVSSSSVVSDATADRYNINLKLGIPTIKRKPTGGRQTIVTTTPTGSRGGIGTSTPTGGG